MRNSKRKPGDVSMSDPNYIAAVEENRRILDRAGVFESGSASLTRQHEELASGRIQETPYYWEDEKNAKPGLDLE